MRFLGIGDCCELADVYVRLAAEGHEVRVSISEPMCHGILAGLVCRTDDWNSDLPWILEAGCDGIVLFESVAHEHGRNRMSCAGKGFRLSAAAPSVTA